MPLTIKIPRPQGQGEREIYEKDFYRKKYSKNAIHQRLR